MQKGEIYFQRLSDERLEADGERTATEIKRKDKR